MKYLIIFIIPLLVMVSCRKEQSQAEPLPKEQLLEESTRKSVRNTIVFDCKIDVDSKDESKLLALVASLSELDNNYQIKSSEKGSVSNSIILNGLKRLGDLRLNNRKEQFEIVNFAQMTNSIKQIQFCYIKGTKDLGGQTYARAKIEELTFKSESCAIEAYQIIEKIKNTGFIWEDIDKSPSSVFIIENRIYYVSSGGWFMMDFYDEIEKKMKE
uniref:hypothetical protein n=1 Tax=Flavobacterium sp. TaxID=239 RepID=UPI00404A7E01